mmetsp:Transcript_86937/g.270225  ORF Transcript_86937/g.270225 Transcript_86937/m.270225 type:complete len:102 (-) Transcript_86937:18-323(-)
MTGSGGPSLAPWISMWEDARFLSNTRDIDSAGAAAHSAKQDEALTRRLGLGCLPAVPRIAVHDRAEASHLTCRRGMCSPCCICTSTALSKPRSLLVAAVQP